VGEAVLGVTERGKLLLDLPVRSGETIKAILGGRKCIGLQDGRERLLLPLSIDYVEEVKQLFPDAVEHPTLTAWREASQLDQLTALQSRTAPLGLELPHPPHWDKLYPYQQAAVEFLALAPNGCLLSLDPGLGKTPVSTLAAESLGAKKILVVTLLSLIYQWEGLIKEWLGDQESIQVVHGDKCWPPLRGDYRWTVTNYDTAVRRLDHFKGPWDLLIVDESIQVKNRKAKRTNTLQKIKAQRKWLLSGNPTSHGLCSDLYSQFRMIKPKVFTSFWRFVNRWVITNETPWGTELEGNLHPDLFRERYRDIYYVKGQGEVDLQLPELLFETIPVQLHGRQLQLYEEMEKEFMVYLEEQGEVLTAFDKLPQMTRLLQILSNPLNIGGPDQSAKRDTLLELLEFIPKPVIVWGVWVPGLKALYSTLRRSIKSLRMMTGATPTDERERIREAFSQGKINALIMNPRVGKFGLNLGKIGSMVYYDRSWDGDDWTQSLFRARRIGQTGRTVVYVLRARRTLDVVVDAVLSGKVQRTSQISSSTLLELMRDTKRSSTSST